MLTTLAATAGSVVATHPYGPWGGGFGWFFLLVPLFWIVVLALVFAIARRARRAAWSGQGGPWSAAPFAQAHAARSAESTLAERFAQGDIDEKEYRARLEVLRATAYPQRPAK